MGKISLVHDIYGNMGSVFEVDSSKVVVIKATVPSKSLSQTRLEEIQQGIKACLGDVSSNYIIVGNDVDVMEAPIEYAVELKISGNDN